MSEYNYIITPVTNQDKLQGFTDLVQNQKIITLDLEGVSLSRIGACTIITIGLVEENNITSYIFDLLHQDKSLVKNMLSIIKKTLEDNNIMKIIHDSRADSDALHKQFDIMLTNIFDTSVAQMILTGKNIRDNLNYTLEYNSCKINKFRPKLSTDFYKNNPNYWSNRPLTQSMIDHAGSDVLSLYELYLVFKNKMTIYDRIILESDKALKEFRDMKEHKFVYVNPKNMGRVIGRGGSNLKNIERRTGVIIASQSGTGGFLVMSNSLDGIKQAENIIKNCAQDVSYY